MSTDWPVNEMDSHPDDLGCFPPGDLFGHCFQQHILQFHHPLHLAAGIRSARFQSLASRSILRFLKRTDHLLIRPDRSYVNDTIANNVLTGQEICDMIR